ncbi:TnsD family Tn7-like transposition protein [Alicyclobacillus mengziensis]|uniref:TniQ family protein n=1 Tax=Alicyclobacillus mengziensis TaxID=2931921 RepID=A0A9X7W0K8_9BACL|nr:TnsD family Tn7-like transposition protein [Alicyclobacillus mengziensis]QSO48506.1 TniQ family protein [Alicyclobacillus mengziensis]
MMNVLPQIYSDELLYSVLARYKHMCGMQSRRAFLKDVYGQSKMLTSIFFPQYLERFRQNLPPYSKITVDELIWNHTMFPFYTAFLSKERSDSIHRMMENGCGKSIENLVGFSGGKVKSYNRLRYCPRCYSEDIDELGESFWRRLHQVPGVLYCLKHGTSLKSTIVPSTERYADYWCADGDVCNADVEDDTYDERIVELSRAYIKNTIFLMDGDYKKKELPDIVDFYVDRLREKGLASANGFIYMNDFVHQFLQFYPSHYLSLMQSNVDDSQQANWLRLFVRNNAKNRSPLRHLLVLQFLGVSAQEFFHERSATGKFTARVNHSPSFNLEERRNAWLKIIETNPGLNRSQLKEIGKGLHTWIYKHDTEWYEQVTPRVGARKKRTPVIDWAKRDEECLALVKQAVESILSRVGKPVRVLPATIRQEIGVRRWLDNRKLVRTRQFIKEATEDINSYRIRKIRWAIRELERDGVNVTVYKVQLHAGFGGNNKEMSKLIERVFHDEVTL